MTADEDGLTAWEALAKLWGGKIPDEKEVTPFMMPGDDYKAYVARRLFRALAKSFYRGTGYRAPATDRGDIPRDYWSFLDIDPDASIASGAGVQFHGLRFFENKPKPKSSSTTKQACLKWLTEEMKGPRTQYKPEYETVALDVRYPGLNPRAFRSAWEEAWKQPGRHKSWKPGPIPGRSKNRSS